MDTKKWQSIGTVLGETNIDHFYFSLKNYKAKKGDIITTESKIPSSEGNIIPSDKPGLGIELNLKVIVANSPYKGKKLHLSMDTKPYYVDDD